MFTEPASKVSVPFTVVITTRSNEPPNAEEEPPPKPKTKRIIKKSLCFTDSDSD